MEAFFFLTNILSSQICLHLCDNLNKNGPQRFYIYLNAWTAGGGSVWEGLGSMAMLAKMFDTGLALRFQKPQLASYLMLVDHEKHDHHHVRSLFLVQCHVCLPTVILPVMMVMDSPSETVSPLNAFFYMLPCS